jgi:hypothetical protein
MDVIIPQQHQAAPNIPDSFKLYGQDQSILLANEYDAKQDAMDIHLARIIAEALEQAYPGHLWAVNVQGDQGIATIHNMMLSGRCGYIMHLDKRYSASDTVRVAKMGAGEILERYNVSRGRINNDRMAEMKMDFAGRVIGDTSK